MRFLSLDITGIDEHTALMWGEPGSGGLFPFFPCLCGDMEEGQYFRESKIVHFRHRPPQHRIWCRPETDTHSVMSNDEKVLRSPLNLLTLKEGMP